MRAPTGQRNQAVREARRAQIIDAAAWVFEGREPAEVTIEEVADAAGVSRALVYNYFGDRQGLVDALHRRSVDRLHARVRAALPADGDLRALVAALVHEHLAFAGEDPAAYRYACSQILTAAAAEPPQEHVAEVARRLGPSAEARLVAQGVVGAVQALVLVWLDEGEPDPARAEEVITAFCWGALRASATPSGGAAGDGQEHPEEHGDAGEPAGPGEAVGATEPRATPRRVVRRRAGAAAVPGA